MLLKLYSLNIIFVILLKSFLFPTFIYGSSDNCPSLCRCSLNGRHADCQGLGLTTFPNLREFSQHLELLDLRRNNIVNLQINLLSSFNHLKTLLLSHNLIENLEQNLLDFLPKLHQLYLGNNKIKLIPKLSSNLISNNYLQLLDLHKNQIKIIEEEAFQNLNNLRILNLEGNFIQSIPKYLFEKNEKLNKLELGDNPWNCDCRLIPLNDLLEKRPELEKLDQHHHHQNKHQANHNNNHNKIAKCANPGHLRNKKISKLLKEELKCFKPEIVFEGISDNNKTKIKCLTKNNEENIQWILNDKSIEMSILGEIEILDDGTLLLGNRELFSKLQCSINYPQISFRQLRDAIVDVSLPEKQNSNIKVLFKPPNLQQSSLQHSQQQNNGNSPQFTYTPRDRRYREGTAVQLNCEAIGNPKPKIYWFFNSQQIEPSRKHTFRNDGSQLLIYPFLEQDIGIYNCEAVNINGRNKSLNARLEIIKSYPPEIIEGPKSKNVGIGQKIIFRQANICKAKGEPKPSIGWFFNGVEISSFGGHFQISEDQSQLTIESVVRRDSGTYSCMAGNTVGSMTSDAQLEINSSQLDEIDKQIINEKTFLKNIVNQATNNIERSILKTKEELKVNSPKDLLKHFKFIGKQQPTELSKAREIYEESLRLIEKHVELGINLKPQEMPTENISFESVLSVTHIQTLMELSGCMSGQFKDTCQDMCFHSKYRSYTGQCNNFDHPTWGVSQMPFLRLLPPIYENGFNTPVGWNKGYLYFGYPKPNPRTVSVELIGAENISPHPYYSAMLMQWGQFLDHDLDFTATALSRQTYVGGARCNRTCDNIAPCFNIPLPSNDYRLQAIANSSDKLPCIEFERSAAICGSGETSPIFQQITYREQANIITSYLDGSQVYGSTEVDALDLRDLFSDHGLLRFDIVSSAQKPYLPFERDSAMDCRRNFSNENPIRCFLSGDFRANEQIGLTAMHTIWMREHNLIATQLLEMNSDWDGERIYQEHITYNEWLPKVLGQEGYKILIGPYNGYSSE
uniref:Ig-like domain-containing protein n=1 Tax=Meloidogyne incognita TaxID=6306 RepID=A0A914NCH4_MELIC